MPGGDTHEEHEAFMVWAAGYDTGGMDMRSRELHRDWMSHLPCPVMKVPGDRDMAGMLSELAVYLNQWV